MTDVLGWAGSALLVHSLLQTRVLRFRALNLAAAVALVVFNVLIAVWPMVAMNAVIAVINVWHLARLMRTRHDEGHYEVVPISAGEPYLRHLLRLHQPDIARFNPGVLATDDTGADLADPGAGERLAFLVLAGAETVGVVLAHRTAPGEAQVDLDYVLPRFRDFTPGEFVYRPGGPFSRCGVRRVVAPRGMREAERYLSDVGFRRVGDDLVLDLAGLTGPE